ncbi:MAG: phosphate ABC transporter substrate-binding protein, partial [Hyphomicrobiaceae bacterium]
YSFLEENSAKLRGVAIEGVAPDFDAIASGKYKGSRKMFVYFKKAHIGVIPGIDKFMAEYVSDKALGKDGYLGRKGLVTLPKAELAAARKTVLGKVELTGKELK